MENSKCIFAVASEMQCIGVTYLCPKACKTFLQSWLASRTYALIRIKSCTTRCCSDSFRVFQYDSFFQIQWVSTIPKSKQRFWSAAKKTKDMCFAHILPWQWNIFTISNWTEGTVSQSLHPEPPIFHCKVCSVMTRRESSCLNFLICSLFYSAQAGRRNDKVDNVSFRGIRKE